MLADICSFLAKMLKIIFCILFMFFMQHFLKLAMRVDSLVIGLENSWTIYESNLQHSRCMYKRLTSLQPTFCKRGEVKKCHVRLKPANYDANGLKQVLLHWNLWLFKQILKLMIKCISYSVLNYFLVYLKRLFSNHE